MEQTIEGSVLPAPDSDVAKRRRSWRQFKDTAARYGVTGGGMMVIVAIVLIFFYLLYVVIPLFSGAHMEVEDEYAADYTGTQIVTLNEYNDVGPSR